MRFNYIVFAGLVPYAAACPLSETSITTTSTAVVSRTASVNATQTIAPTVTTSAPGVGTTCTVTAYTAVSSAVKSCKNIVLSGISAPPSSTLSLALQTGAALAFAGETTFGNTPDNDFDPIVISGTNITITGQPGHVIDGNGPVYWDGLGSNGGSAKPDHFIVVKKTTNARITGLNIKNWPVHCFQITGARGLTIEDLTLDNSEGDAPNSASGGKAAAHNSDGFDISSSNHVTLNNINVHNQDDCVAVTSGTDINVSNMYCYGGHGLSIGSIGGKSNNTVNGVTFSDSIIVDSENGARIKTNSGTNGTVDNVTYKNITLSGITKYGIDVQQDYLNGGPTGSPTNGVKISGVSFIDVKGTTASSSAYDYYILCGDGSCADFTFTDVSVTGGKASCNYPTSTCPS